MCHGIISDFTVFVFKVGIKHLNSAHNDFTNKDAGLGGAWRTKGESGGWVWRTKGESEERGGEGSGGLKGRVRREEGRVWRTKGESEGEEKRILEDSRGERGEGLED
ncbi:hypothetical protein NL108_016862 [Boleophthalmus pectinirostris]|nr:hypothetical protein NL108_016862 [Boleophthalmus pectinirostris]